MKCFDKAYDRRTIWRLYRPIPLYNISKNKEANENITNHSNLYKNSIYTNIC